MDEYKATLLPRSPRSQQRSVGFQPNVFYPTVGFQPNANTPSSMFLNPFKPIEKHRYRLSLWHQDRIFAFVTYPLTSSIPKEVITQLQQTRVLIAWHHHHFPWHRSLLNKVAPANAVMVENQNETSTIPFFAL